MKNPWKTNSSKIVYENKYIKIREDQITRPNGEKGIYSVLVTNDSVFIIPITKSGKILLIKQIRYTTGEQSWELPAGNTDGEKFEVAAIRELEEETGFISEDLTYLGYFHALNGLGKEKGHIYLAKDLKKTNKSKMLEEGIVEIKEFGKNEIIKMIKENRITDCQTISSLYKYFLFMDDTQ